MGNNTGEIQPVTRDVWLQPEQSTRDARTVIPPVAKAEGAKTKKVADDRADRGDRGDSTHPGIVEKNEKLVEQLQAFIDEALNVQLNFKVDNQTKETVVQVVDRESGKIIRQIPTHNLQNLRQKLEELRGIMFDGRV